jgi:hypothetical protein
MAGNSTDVEKQKALRASLYEKQSQLLGLHGEEKRAAKAEVVVQSWIVRVLG